MSSAVPWSGDVRGNGKPERHVHRAAERCDFDRRHSDIVVRRDHGIEFSAHRPNEYGIGRKRAGNPRQLRAAGARTGRRPQSPNRPPSPACGLSAQSAMRGPRMPNHEASPRARDRRHVARSPLVSADAAHRVVRRASWPARRAGSSDASIMATRLPVSAASISVWPGKS